MTCRVFDSLFLIPVYVCWWSRASSLSFVRSIELSHSCARCSTLNARPRVVWCSVHLLNFWDNHNHNHNNNTSEIRTVKMCTFQNVHCVTLCFRLFAHCVEISKSIFVNKCHFPFIHIIISASPKIAQTPTTIIFIFILFRYDFMCLFSHFPSFCETQKKPPELDKSSLSLIRKYVRRTDLTVLEI